MPPRYLIAVAELPTEKNNSPVSHIRKVDQAATVILHLYAELGDLGRELADLIQHVHIGAAAAHPAAELRCRRGGAGVLAQHVNMRVETLYRLELWSDYGQEGVSLVERKELHGVPPTAVSSSSKVAPPAGTNCGISYSPVRTGSFRIR